MFFLLFIFLASLLSQRCITQTETLIKQLNTNLNIPIEQAIVANLAKVTIYENGKYISITKPIKAGRKTTIYFQSSNNKQQVIIKNHRKNTMSSFFLNDPY